MTVGQDLFDLDMEAVQLTSEQDQQDAEDQRRAQPGNAETVEWFYEGTYSRFEQQS